MDGMKLCKFEGCDRKHKAKGFCGSHYESYRRNGEARELAFIRDGRSKTVDGYVRIRINGRYEREHRLVNYPRLDICFFDKPL